MRDALSWTVGPFIAVITEGTMVDQNDQPSERKLTVLDLWFNIAEDKNW